MVPLVPFRFHPKSFKNVFLKSDVFYFAYINLRHWSKFCLKRQNQNEERHEYYFRCLHVCNQMLTMKQSVFASYFYVE